MKQGIEVFDFNEEDELPELDGGKILENFKNPNRDDSGILKYRFLQTFSQGSDAQKKESGSVPCLDVDAIDSDHRCENTSTKFAAKEENSVLDVASQLNSRSPEQQPYLKQDSHDCRSFCPDLESRNSCHEPPSPSTNQLNCALSDSPSNNESVDVMSDDDETMNDHSLSSPASDIAEDVGAFSMPSLNGQTTGSCFGDLEMDDKNMAVVLSPDYVVVQDNYCNAALVTFSRSGIKIKSSTICDNQGSLTFEWGVDDIIRIECRWFQRVGLVILKLCVLSKDVIQAEDVCGASGIEELKFAVVEQNWSEKQEKITSLNVKYLAIWDVVLDEDTETNGENSCQQGHYFPDFDEPFEDVIYPKGDSDAVSISKRDVDLLQPETFINDTIIDFYIKYLKNHIQPEERHRFHFFNSFFFRKLADLDKDPSSISDGRAAFLRVHKWTRKVDMFGKDYVFIPVNFNLHWSLIVICHPGEVTNFRDEELDKLLQVPCILHMDSIKGSHAGLKNLVQSYLCEEWKERHKETSEDISSKFLNLRFVSLELPQQENSFDCGLFLLHYLELFLAEAPVNFSPFKITKFSNFLNADWFPPAEASLKRTFIQKLIFELLENRSQEVSSDDHLSKFPENNENETGVEFLSKRCSPSAACYGNLSNSQAGQGIEVTLLAASSVRNLHSVNDSGLVLRELFNPGATAGSLLGQFQSFDQPSSFYHLNGAISLREQEDAETSEQFVYLTSGESNFQQISGITAHAGDFSISSRGFGSEMPWNPGKLIQGEHEVDSSSETSLYYSDDSEDVGIIDNNAVMKDAGINQNGKTDQRRSPSVENIKCLTEGPASVSSELLEAPVMDGSCGPDVIHNSNENGELHPSEEHPTMSSHHDANVPENRLHEDSEMFEDEKASCNDTGINADDLLTDSHEQRATKRLRLAPPVEGEIGVSGSLSKDLHL